MCIPALAPVCLVVTDRFSVQANLTPSHLGYPLAVITPRSSVPVDQRLVHPYLHRLSKCLEWNPVIARHLRRRRDFLLLFSSFCVYSVTVIVVVTNAVIAVSSLVSGTGLGCCSWRRMYRQNKEWKKGWLVGQSETTRSQGPS